MKGSGTVTFNTGDPVDPSRVAAAGTGNQITFDFKAAGTMDGGAVSMDVQAIGVLHSVSRGLPVM